MTGSSPNKLGLQLRPCIHRTINLQGATRSSEGMSTRGEPSLYITELTWTMCNGTRSLSLMYQGSRTRAERVRLQFPSCITPSTVIVPRSISGASFEATFRGMCPICTLLMFLTWIAFLCEAGIMSVLTIFQSLECSHPSYRLWGSLTRRISSPGPTIPL